MKLFSILILFLISILLIKSSPAREEGIHCKFGAHFRIFKFRNHLFRKFHKCMCPLKPCEKIKKCKFGIPYVLEIGGCKTCVKCRKSACPPLRKIKRCLKYGFKIIEGCKVSRCICRKRKCKLLKTKCSLGVEIKKDWRGCDMCPQCKCRINCPRLGGWERRRIRRNCKYGAFIPKSDKEGCPTGCYQCRKNPCKKMKCRECQYGIKKWNYKVDHEGCSIGCHICKPKPKVCDKLKCKALKCSLGVRNRRDWRGCDMCPKCRCKKLNCPRFYKRCKYGGYYPIDKEGCSGCRKCRKKPCKKMKCRNCQNGIKKWNDKFDHEGCAIGCHKCCEKMKCKKCEYGVKRFVYHEDCEMCPICNEKPKNCKKLKCSKLKTKCSLGIEIKKDWRGCDMCPQCKCNPIDWNLKCKFGHPYRIRNKEGCFEYKCRKTKCPVLQKPKEKCDFLWWSMDKGCASKPFCYVNPCKKFLNCVPVNCTYGVFVPRDPKTGCKQCEYCENPPTPVIKPTIVQGKIVPRIDPTQTLPPIQIPSPIQTDKDSQIDLEIKNLERIIDWI